MTYATSIHSLNAQQGSCLHIYHLTIKWYRQLTAGFMCADYMLIGSHLHFQIFTLAGRSSINHSYLSTHFPFLKLFQAILITHFHLKIRFRNLICYYSNYLEMDDGLNQWSHFVLQVMSSMPYWSCYHYAARDPRPRYLRRRCCHRRFIRRYFLNSLSHLVGWFDFDSLCLSYKHLIVVIWNSI